MTIPGLLQRWRRWRLARHGVCVDRSCTLGSGISLGFGSRPFRAETVSMGTECQIGNGVELDPWGGFIRLGKNIFIGPYTVIYGHGGIEVGDHTLIAMHCCILSSNHTIPPRGQVIRHHPDILLPTKIGRDAWLGAGVKVLGGVTIGDGCVVGAGAVVAKDLPDYAIAVGVPARVTGYRTP